MREECENQREEASKRGRGREINITKETDRKVSVMERNEEEKERRIERQTERKGEREKNRKTNRKKRRKRKE